MAEIEKMSEAQIHRFIFAPGFSTAAKVTSVSGRGVGMDVVLSNIDQIGGSVDVKSIPGEGSIFTIKIPLTLAIISALIIEAGGERFAIPQLAVIELVRVKNNTEHRIEHIKDTPVLRLRNKLLPLIHLGRLLKLDSKDTQEVETGFIVVTQIGSRMFGIVVDGVFHTEEIVVKPMATKLRHISAFSGNTILGDGSVIMILDPNGVAEAVGASTQSAMHGMEHAARKPAMSRTRPRSWSSAPAPPIPRRCRSRSSRGSRKSRPRRSNCRTAAIFCNIAASSCRSSASTTAVKIKDDGTQSLLVFADGVRAMALVVDEIVDIVEDTLNIEIPSEQPGILGSAVIKGEATEILDVGHFLPLAFADWFRGAGDTNNAPPDPQSPLRRGLRRSSATC